MRNSQNKNQYRMPAEWEKQKSTWIAWPHNKSDWPGLFKQIPSVFFKIICEITKVQKVCEELGVNAILAEHWKDGGKGASKLAETVILTIQNKKAELKLSLIHI